MGAHKANSHPERFVLVFSQQLSSLFGRLSVGVNEIITVCFHDDERVSSNRRFLAIGIVFEGLAIAGSFPFGAGAVKSFGPAGFVVGTVVVVVIPTVAPDFNSAGNAHMENFRNPCGVVAVVFEHLRPHFAITDLRSWIFVTENARRVRIVAAHKRRPTWSAVSSLAIRLGITGAARGDSVNVRRLTNFITVAGKRCVSQVIRNDEENVVFLIGVLCAAKM